ncbi:MAG: hypothetical protein RIT45_2999 [Pseudomonadota bacterium]
MEFQRLETTSRTVLGFVSSEYLRLGSLEFVTVAPGRQEDVPVARASPQYPADAALVCAPKINTSSNDAGETGEWRWYARAKTTRVSARRHARSTTTQDAVAATNRTWWREHALLQAELVKLSAVAFISRTLQAESSTQHDRVVNSRAYEIRLSDYYLELRTQRVKAAGISPPGVFLKSPTSFTLPDLVTVCMVGSSRVATTR